MINVRNLYFSYILNNAKERPVLSNLNFDIKEGQFVSILGYSGCGKTTLVNILAGYLNTKIGKVLINKIETKSPGKNRVVVNQENDLFEWMTVLGNMELVSNDHVNINKFLKLMGLDGFKQDFPNNLSGGMKKRLSLARALVVNPKFLILDDPFASLDHQNKEALHLELDKIFSLTKKTTFLVTHDIDEAIFLSDRIIILEGKPATIVGDIRVNFSHPRKLDIKSSGEFNSLKNKIKTALHKVYN